MFSSTAKKIISSFFLTATLSSVLFFLPVALNTNTVRVAYAEEPVTTPAPTTSHVGTTADSISSLCGITSGTAISNCVLLLEYYLMVSVPRQLLLFAANVFDTMWAFGLSSETFTLGNSPDSFINAGWVVCRDVANTFFIFILLYIAIMTIFQKDQKRLLSTLVVVALLINFSMYITKFVIDVGNIFALEFYSSFPVNSNPLVIIPGIEQHSIGSGFMKALESPLENIIQDIPNHKGSFGVQASLIALTGIELLVVTFVFLLSGFYLVGRVVTLWIVMITSPLAFFSMALPSEVSGVSVWGEWKKQLISNSFFPAIFLFFIYIAAKIANGNSWILQNFATDTVGIDAFIKLGLQFAVIIAFLLYGLKKANSMSGAAGTIADKYGRLGTGFVTGAALGTVAGVGRQFMGRAATNIKQSEWGKRQAESKFGRSVTLPLLNTASTGTWDIRNTKAGGSLVSQSQGLIGKDFTGKEGFAGALQKKQQANKATFDSLKGNPKAQAEMIASLRNPSININGVEQFPEMNPDRDATALISNLSVKERQDLIEAAKGTSHEGYLKKINQSLAETFNPGQRKDEFNLLKENPKKQAEMLTELHNKGKLEEIAPLFKELKTQEERYKVIQNTTGDIKKFLIEENRKRIEKLTKPDQKVKEERQWKELESMTDFNATMEKYRKEVNPEEKKIHAKELGENFVKLTNEQASNLDFKDLMEESIIKRLSSEKLKAIKKKSGSKFTLEEEEQFDEEVKKKSKSEEVRDQADLNPTGIVKKTESREAKQKKQREPRVREERPRQEKNVRPEEINPTREEPVVENRETVPEQEQTTRPEEINPIQEETPNQTPRT